MVNQPRLYSDLAEWWPLLSPPSGYVEEAEFYRCALDAAAGEEIETVLELGSGGGNNASHLKQHYRMTLVDPAPGMLAHSRAINPECEHVEGDMRTVRLGHEFDAVFVHDAICYMTTVADLRAAIETARVHCKPGGVVLLAPDFVRETFRESTDCDGTNGEGRALRYMEWTHDPDPTDTMCIADYVYALRHEDGTVTVEHDRHIEGIFERDVWLGLLRDAGFDARSIPFDHSDYEGELEVFVGRRVS